MSRRILLCASVTLVAIGVLVTTASAQPQEPRPSMSCNSEGLSANEWRSQHCEVKEQTLATTGAINVDGMQNGGISVKGWGRNETLVRYRIQTQAATKTEADNIASQIRVNTAGGQIRTEGPEQLNDASWSVSYEIFVPRRSDVALATHNGGISIYDVSGKITFEAQNGGVSLKRLGGSVSGETTNGGLSVELTGANWEGEGLDVKTTNGGLSVSVPNNYSAHLQTGTVNGHLSVSPSIAEVTRETKRLALNLGAGGTNLRIFTTNGGVSIKRSEAH